MNSRRLDLKGEILGDILVILLCLLFVVFAPSWCTLRGTNEKHGIPANETAPAVR